MELYHQMAGAAPGAASVKMLGKVDHEKKLQLKISVDERGFHVVLAGSEGKREGGKEGSKEGSTEDDSRILFSPHPGVLACIYIYICV
jgi:hypothetical protein